MSDTAIAALIEMIRQHTEDDRANFTVIREQLSKIETNTSSLLQTRSFGRGVSKVGLWAVGALATLAGTGLSTFVAWVFRASH
jgi:hypothetical protein